MFRQMWQNKNARLPYLQDLVLTLEESRSKAVLLRSRQEDISPNVVVTSKSMAVRIWLT